MYAVFLQILLKYGFRLDNTSQIRDDAEMRDLNDEARAAIQLQLAAFDLSQADLSRLSTVSTSAISRYLKGEDIRAKDLAKLLSALKIDIKCWFGEHRRIRRAIKNELQNIS